MLDGRMDYCTGGVELLVLRRTENGNMGEFGGECTRLLVSCWSQCTKEGGKEIDRLPELQEREASRCGVFTNTAPG
jgi:hypothetical protein